MGLTNLLFKAAILVLDLRDTYHALDAVKLDEIGRSERQVLVRNAQVGTKQLTTRKRMGTSKRKAAVRSALTTVLVWNLFSKVEPLCDRTIAWFVPFYDSFKTLFLIWMLFTRSYGASILIFRLLAPIIRPYEPIIDGIFGLTLSLLTWIATSLAPTIDKCAKLMYTLRSTFEHNAQSTATHPATLVAASSSGQGKAPQRKSSATSVGARAGKKPPPPSSPPVSIKSSPASAAASLAVKSGPQHQPNIAATKPRQALAGKISHGSLAATRRVLQELPVPSHAFDSGKSQASPSTSSPASKATNAAHDFAASSSAEPAIVKAEPNEPPFKPPAAILGPPPTPPTGLQNYAFIPGLTPSRSGQASLASPTPRFPGGFSFSAAASIVNNPFQAPARVPLTTQMAPLSFSSQIAAPLGGHHLLGSNNGAATSVSTHENVTSAKDDRIVPPPNQATGVRTVSSVRSLKSKAAKNTMQNGDKAAVISNGKKRPRSADATGGENGEAEGSASNSTSPRKRVKSVAGQQATSKKAAGPVTTAKTRVKKSTSTNGQTPAPGGSIGARKRDGLSGTSSAARKATVSARSGSASTSTPANENSSTSTSGSIEDKAKVASTKATAQRTAVKKVPSTSKSRSQSTEAAEPPPQRLTRSRTKQNLAD